jgi:hypothetical protein
MPPGSLIATDGSSPEFPRDVEAQECVVGRTAASELTDRRPNTVRDIDLKQMAADSFF